MNDTSVSLGVPQAAAPETGLLRKLDVKLIHGSITDVPCQAYVLGLFDNVNPAGTARTVNAVLDGKLSHLAQDRIFGNSLARLCVSLASTHAISTNATGPTISISTIRCIV